MPVTREVWPNLAGSAETGRTRRWHPWRTAGWAAGALMLLVALVAKQFVGEPSWVDTLAQTGALLIGIGIAVELASRKTGPAAYRTAVALALGSAVLLGWANGAVGLIGSEDNTANLMYGGVLVVGALGAVIARFKPEGMARALFATALAQTSVAMITLILRLGAPRPLDPRHGALQPPWSNPSARLSELHVYEARWLRASRGVPPMPTASSRGLSDAPPCLHPWGQSVEKGRAPPNGRGLSGAATLHRVWSRALAAPAPGSC